VARISDTSTVLTFSSVTATSNSAVERGGVVYCKEIAQFKSVGSTYTYNSSSQGSVLYLILSSSKETSFTTSTLKNNKGDGVFYIIQGVVSVKQSTISSNEVSGLQMTPGIQAITSTVTTESVTFYNQTALQGAFLAAQLNSVFTDTGSTYDQGSSSSEGGAIYVLQSEVTVKGSSFSNIYSKYSGAFYVFSTSTLTLNGVTMKDIKSKEAGMKIESDSTLTLSSSVLSNFNSTAISAELSSVVISDSTIKEVSAESGGALLCSDCDGLTITGSKFQNVTATATGGCLYLSSETVYSYNISNNLFYNCSALHAGAVYSDELNVTFVNNNFSHNAAKGGSESSVNDGSGGALNLNCAAKDCKFNLTNNNFEYNSAKYNGGAIVWNDVEPTFVNNSYASNYAVYGADVACFGSYLSIESSSGRRHLTTLENIASGQTSSHIEILLKDKYGNTVTTDNSSIASLATSEDEIVLGGITSVTASGGLYNFSSFSITATPGSSKSITINSGAIASSSTNSIEIAVELRYCEAGEIQTSDNACLECDEGTYSLDLNATYCISCPSEAECLGGADIYPVEGYWRSSEDNDNFFECLLEAACLGNEDYSSKTGACDDGYKSNLCQSCEDDWSRTSKNTCQRCPSDAINAVRLCGIGLGVIIYVVIMVRSTLLSAAKPKELYSVYIKVLTNYLQLVLLITSFNLNWPSLVKQLLSSQESVGSASEQLFSFDCYLQDAFSTEVFYQKLAIVALLPILIVVISALVWFPVAIKNKDMMVLRNQLVTTIIVLLFLAHPSIVQTMFKVFSCMEIDSEEYWLLEDLSIKCWNTEHSFYALAVGLPGLVGWGLGIPSFALYLLIRKRKVLITKDVKSKYGFLYIGFKPENFFWEFIITYRKIAIAFTSVFLSTISAEIQALTVMIVILIALYLQLRYLPYEVDDLNMVEARAIIVAGITIYSGLYFLTNDLGEGTKIFLFLVIVLSNAYFITLWTFGISKSLIVKLSVHYPYQVLKCCGCIPTMKDAAMKAVKEKEGELFYGSKLAKAEQKILELEEDYGGSYTELRPINSPKDLFIMMVKKNMEEMRTPSPSNLDFDSSFKTNQFP